MDTAPDHARGVAFDRHLSRRAQGVPTLSVLLGGVDVARWCWTKWQRGRGASVADVELGELGPMLHAWFSAGAVHAALAEELIRRGACAERVSPEEFRARLDTLGHGSRGGFLERTSGQLGWSAPLEAAGVSQSPEPLVDAVVAGFPRALADVEAALPSGLPPVFAATRVEPSARVLKRAVTALIEIAETTPRLELALALTDAQLETWTASAERRELALIQEGSIQLEPSPAVLAPIARAPVASASSARPCPAEPERGAGATLARAGRQLAPAARLEYDPSEFARSQAERALFEQLQRRARTRGLFALNAALPESFGGRALEVDLLSAGLRIAVEVDGYHHFRDASAYRRDRDKDVRLQGLGYTVVRVLAADVDAELDFVLETIDRVVEHERQKRAQ